MQHAGLEAVELVHAGVRMVVVTEVGPRIAWFGRTNGENLLYWDEQGTHRRGLWQLRGGHRLWTTRPGADESEETYRPDNDRCRVRLRGTSVTVEAPPTIDGLRKSLAIGLDGDAWTIRHRVVNASDMLWSGGAWALTCAHPRSRTRFEIPLDGGNPAWDIVTIAIPRAWGGNHRSTIDDDQIVLARDRLIARARGRECKRMLLAPRGQLEMIDPTHGHFIKRSRYVAEGHYPLATNVAIYLAPKAFMVELETMSPQRTLVPGDSIDHVEQWSLT